MRNRRIIRFLILIFAITVLKLTISNNSVNAAEGGFSNYLPGTYGDFAAAVEPATKWTIRNDVYYYNADGGRSVRSGLLELDSEVDFLMNFLTVLYKPEIELFSTHYAFGVFIPLVYADIGADLRINELIIRRNDDIFSIGDITLIPAIFFWNIGNFHFSLAEYIITPTGTYDSDDLANAGLNYWTFDTNLAVTYLNTERGQDYSVNFGYIYNTENPDTDYQTGQEIHIDYMLNQFLSDSFAVGIQGFYLKQITGDSGDGAILGDFKGEAAGIGPAVLWSTNISGFEITFIAKWLHEFHAENRLEGNHFFISFALGL